MSQPFCVDQLNPAGFKVFNVPYKENSRFFSYAGNWITKNKYGGGRFVADDIHFQFSQWLWLWYFTEDTSENENENIYTEASGDNSHQTQKALQSLKSAGVRRCQSRSTGSSCHPVELIKLLKTTYKQWQPVCFRESEEAKGSNKN